MLTIAARAGHEQIQFARRMQLLYQQGHDIDEILASVIRARIGLAQSLVDAGDQIYKLAGTNEPLLRSSVSRYYYSMYHACRAVVYQKIQGDDHDGHQSLASHLPSDFPNQAAAKNSFKTMRLLRNDADYEPYERVGSWATEAQAAQTIAADFLQDCRIYLQQKGIQC